MKTPSEELAEKIVPLLTGSRLFLAEDATRNKIKIASGSMKAEDWLISIEKALDKENQK